jgi:hypothetical protein
MLSGMSNGSDGLGHNSFPPRRHMFLTGPSNPPGPSTMSSQSHRDDRFPTPGLDLPHSHLHSGPVYPTFPSTSPDNTRPMVRFDPSPTESMTAISNASGSRKKDTPETRLIVASQGAAPFQPLTYQPSLWENREQSRRSTPAPGIPPSRDESWGVFEARAGPRDDPVTEGYIDSEMSEVMFKFFFDHCHHFLPVVQFNHNQNPDSEEVRHRSAYLYTTIIAIAARFYVRHCHRFPAEHPTLNEDAPGAIAHLAYSHLAASMFRKVHQLADVQATLLLAGWGLQSGGRGPDPWLVTGHCIRLSRRLGLHKVAATAQKAVQAMELGTLDKASGEDIIDKLLPQWRTWLGWYQ